MGVAKKLAQGKPYPTLPVGALVLFIQKGLQYVELEANNAEVRSHNLCVGTFCPLVERNVISVAGAGGKSLWGSQRTEM